MRLIPQEHIQPRTVEQIVVVPILQLVKEMVKNQSASSTEMVMVQKTVEVLPQVQSLIER